MIPGPGGLKFTEGRFLDPTPEYQERLRLSEVIYRRRFPLPADIDIDGKAIFTAAEVGVLLGWSEKYTLRYLWEHKVPCVKIGGGERGGLRLYTAKTIREMIWRRSGRVVSQQRAPFLIPEILDFFRKRQDNDFPTDAELAEDDRFRKKLERITKMPSPQKEEALRELLAKVELAKQVCSQSPKEYRRDNFAPAGTNTQDHGRAAPQSR